MRKSRAGGEDFYTETEEEEESSETEETPSDGLEGTQYSQAEELEITEVLEVTGLGVSEQTGNSSYQSYQESAKRLQIEGESHLN